MDGYPPKLVAHNLPLLVVSGLDPRCSPTKLRPKEGIEIKSEIPPVESDDAQVLLRHFTESDARNLAWNGREHTGRDKFMVKVIGRVF